MLTGWTPPTKIDASGNIVVKNEVEWPIEEDKLATSNWRALNAIFNGVDPTQFKSISTTELAKEVWDTLQVEFEGTNTIRELRLQFLTTKFENLYIQEDETIGQYNAWV